MSKYMWSDLEFEAWVKKQVHELRKIGLTQIGTTGATKLLLHKVLLPNNINLTGLIKPNIKIKRGRKVVKY